MRSKTEVARRALCLFSAFGVAAGAPKPDVLAWLSDEKLEAYLSPRESAFLAKRKPSTQEKIDFSWQSERLAVLLWALNAVRDLPGDDEEVDTAVFQALMPPFANVSVVEFMKNATLRSAAVLRAEEQRVYDLHARLRSAQLGVRKSVLLANIEIVQERHHALLWLREYEGQAWDDVTTDT